MPQYRETARPIRHPQEYESYAQGVGKLQGWCTERRVRGRLPFYLPPGKAVELYA